MIEKPSNQTLQPLYNVVGSNIPIPACIYFSATTTRHVFCVDASVNSAQICANFGLSYQFVQSLDVPLEQYNNEYLVGMDSDNPGFYHLFKVNKPVLIDLSG